ncbi:MAG: FtsW/RodA/SpoVE family cell cycle protein [Clostridia bacterium]|nr:FtsW/RodA/SpoVE family cell cycle protein [Clostridia bacterium]MBR6512941.1 FtsW/RodA/SpoVE family cell cycle protein [Clostridia bacterium]
MAAENGKRRIDPKLVAHGGLDLPFLTLVLALLTIGLIMMFSASYTYCYYNNNGDSLYYFRRQFFFAVAGIIAMFAASKFHYRAYRFFARPLIAVSFVLLLVVLVVPPPAGYEGFHRWLYIPGLVSFQPSEIAKLAIIIFLAKDIGDHYTEINSDKKMKLGNGMMYAKTFYLLRYLIIIGAFSVLVLAENHVSGTILIFALGIMMLWLAGFDSKWFILAGIAVIAVAIIVIIKPSILPAHAQPRITAWLDKDYDPQGVRWQTNNALYAIGSGGWFGVGLGNSKQKQLYVSEPMNDFIFSIVCEELGIIGAAIIIILFVLLVWRGFYIATKTDDRFASLLALGLSFQIGLQAALNIAVVTDVLPNTGISLPFFSYGGTSLLMLLGEMGLILGVSRYANIKKSWF